MQRITIITEMIDKVSKKAKQISNSMRGIDQRSKVLNRGFQRQAVNQEQLNSAMKHYGVRLDKTKGFVSNNREAIRGLGFDTNKAGQVVEKNTRQFVAQGKVLDKLSGKSRNFAKRFRFHMLSVLFFGMAIQRFFQQWMQTGTQTLIKITEGGTAQAQAVIGLQSAWKMLQFSVGEAIGEFMRANPLFMNIINTIIQFIQENRGLVGGIMVLGMIFGTLLMTMGIVDLGMQGIIKLFGDFKRLILWFPKTGIPKLKSAWTTLTAVMSKAWAKFTAFMAANPIILILLLIIATIIALKFAWENNWLNIRQITGTIVKGIANLFWILVEVGQGLLTSWMSIWNTLLDVVEMAASPIVNALNGISAAFAFLTNQTFEPIRLDLSGFKADINEVNKGIDEWQNMVQYDILAFGEKLIRQGEAINQQKEAGTFKGYGLGEFGAEAMTGFGLFGSQKTERNVNIGTIENTIEMPETIGTDVDYDDLTDRYNEIMNDVVSRQT